MTLPTVARGPNPAEGPVRGPLVCMHSAGSELFVGLSPPPGTAGSRRAGSIGQDPGPVPTAVTVTALDQLEFRAALAGLGGWPGALGVEPGPTRTLTTVSLLRSIDEMGARSTSEGEGAFPTPFALRSKSLGCRTALVTGSTARDRSDFWFRLKICAIVVCETSGLAPQQVARGTRFSVEVDF